MSDRDRRGIGLLVDQGRWSGKDRPAMILPVIGSGDLLPDLPLLARPAGLASTNPPAERIMGLRRVSTCSKAEGQHRDAGPIPAISTVSEPRDIPGITIHPVRALRALRH